MQSFLKGREVNASFPLSSYLQCWEGAPLLLKPILVHLQTKQQSLHSFRLVHWPNTKKSAFPSEWHVFSVFSRNRKNEWHFILLKPERMLLATLLNILISTAHGALCLLSGLGQQYASDAGFFQVVIWCCLSNATLQLVWKNVPFYIFLFCQLRILNPKSSLTAFQGGKDCLLCAGMCPLCLILTNGDEIALGSWYYWVFPFEGWIPSQEGSHQQRWVWHCCKPSLKQPMQLCQH